MKLELRDEPDGLRVLVDGRDISAEIRTPEVTRQIYRLDQNAGVREPLVELQRAYAVGRPTVAEGRDMGTVVFPHAKCKIFLDASIDERARRRAEEMAAKSLDVDLDALRREIHERDEKSRNRKVSPLRQAEDAVLLDTTHRTLDQVVAAIVEMARQRL
jgi:cytidylate kinase